MWGPQGYGQWNHWSPWGPGAGEEAVGLRCDGCERGSTQESLLSWKCQRRGE